MPDPDEFPLDLVLSAPQPPALSPPTELDSRMPELFEELQHELFTFSLQSLYLSLFA